MLARHVSPALCSRKHIDVCANTEPGSRLVFHGTRCGTGRKGTRRGLPRHDVRTCWDATLADKGLLASFTVAHGNASNSVVLCSNKLAIPNSTMELETVDHHIQITRPSPNSLSRPATAARAHRRRPRGTPGARHPRDPRAGRHHLHVHPGRRLERHVRLHASDAWPGHHQGRHHLVRLRRGQGWGEFLRRLLPGHPLLQLHRPVALDLPRQRSEAVQRRPGAGPRRRAPEGHLQRQHPRTSCGCTSTTPTTARRRPASPRAARRAARTPTSARPSRSASRAATWACSRTPTAPPTCSPRTAPTVCASTSSPRTTSAS